MIQKSWGLDHIRSCTVMEINHGFNSKNVVTMLFIYLADWLPFV